MDAESMHNSAPDTPLGCIPHFQKAHAPQILNAFLNYPGATPIRVFSFASAGFEKHSQTKTRARPRHNQHTTKTQHDTRRNTTQRNTTQHNATQHNTTQHNTTQHNTIQQCIASYNTTNNNISATTKRSITHHNIIQYST